VYATTVQFARDVVQQQKITPGARGPTGSLPDQYLRSILSRFATDWDSRLRDAGNAASLIWNHLDEWRLVRDGEEEVHLPPWAADEDLRSGDPKIVESISEALRDQADVMCAYPDLATPLGSVVESNLALGSLVVDLQRLIWPLTPRFFFQALFSGSPLETEVGHRMIGDEERHVLAALVERYPNATTGKDLMRHPGYVGDVRRTACAARDAAKSVVRHVKAARQGIRKYALRLGVGIP
jgi:hypothetical protein